MKPETYKAAIYRDVGRVELMDLPYPECGDDDVIIKNRISGVCGSDVSAYFKGGDPVMIWKDHEFGHEMVSEVVEVGKNVAAVKLGDYVWPHMGHALRDRSRMATVGGFSEYIRIIQYEEGYSAFPLDKSIPLEWLAMVEPFIIGTRGALNTEPGPGKTAIVYGAGIIGMSCAIMLKYFGCEKVMIVDLADSRLARAEKYGLITVNSGKEDLRARAIEVFGADQSIQGECCKADVHVDCIGVMDVIDNYTSLARRGAMLVVVGAHHKPVCLDFVKLSYGQWNIKGCGITPAGEVIQHVLAMMKTGRFDLSPLVSHKYRLGQVEDALNMAGNPDQAQKVLVDYT